MSEKRQVPTFRIMLVHGLETLEGPVVSPDRLVVADTLGTVHTCCAEHHGLLIYDKQWIYLPAHAVLSVRRGTRRFWLPWPLVDEPTDTPSSTPV